MEARANPQHVSGKFVASLGVILAAAIAIGVGSVMIFYAYAGDLVASAVPIAAIVVGGLVGLRYLEPYLTLKP